MTRKVRGESDIKFGFVFQGARYEGGVCDACEFIWGHGGNVLDPRTRQESSSTAPRP